MQSFHRLARGAAVLADHVVGWLLLTTVVINVAQVFTRYVMNDPLFWTEETIRYITVWFTFVGAASCSEAEEHMDMNLFLEVKNELFQRVHRVFLNLLIIVFGVFVVWQGSRYTWLNGLQTAPTTGLPMMFVYSATAFGGLLLILIALRKIALAVWPASDRDPPPFPRVQIL